MKVTLVNRPFRVFIGLAVLGGVLFFQALDYPFHYDDHHSVQYNPHTRSLSNLPSFFVDPGTFSSRPSGFMFRPALLTSYALNYYVSGQREAGYRLVNLLLHVVASFAVYSIAARFFVTPGVAIGAGFLFLTHPMHAEVIHYVSSRSILMAATFFLTAFAILDGKARRAPHAAIASIAYICGLLTKSVAITLPFIAFVSDVSRSDTSRSGMRQAVAGIRRYWYLWSIAGLYLIAIWSNRFLSSSLEKRPRSFAWQFWTQLKAFVYYIKLTLFPVNGSIEHQFSVATTALNWEVMLPAAFLLSISVVTAVISQRVLLFCWAWFVITLAPASVMPLNILVSERRMYLAMAGLLLACCWFWERWAAPARTVSGRWRAGGVAVAVIALFCVLTLQRSQVWADDVSLWEDAVAKGPAMHRARLNLGLAYQRQGRTDDALRELSAGLQLRQDNAEAWVAFGNIHSDRGDWGRAESAYRQALERDARLAGVHHNLGNLKQRAGHIDEAISHYERALEVDAHFVKARNNLGQAYESAGRNDEAALQYELAVRDSLFWKDVRDPELGGTWYNLARIRERSDDIEGARDAYRRAHDLLEDHEEYADFSSKAEQGWRRLQAAAADVESQ